MVRRDRTDRPTPENSSRDDLGDCTTWSTTIDERCGEPEGFVQFSVLHPVRATPIRRWVNDASGRREAYARRTLAGWINVVAAVGLAIEAIAEPRADEQTARDHPEVADTRIAPSFLIVRARKPAASSPD